MCILLHGLPCIRENCTPVQYDRVTSSAEISTEWACPTSWNLKLKSHEFVSPYALQSRAIRDLLHQ